MTAPLHEREGFGGAVEREHLLDDRFEPVRRYGAVHRFETRAGADRNSLDAHHRADELADIYVRAVPAHKADHAHEAAKCNRRERLRQGTGSLDYDIRAAPARNGLSRGAPLRHGAIIDGRIGAEITRP